MPAVPRWRRREGQHLVPLGQPLVELHLEHGSAGPGAQALAVHDADAAVALQQDVRHELPEHAPCLVGGEAVEVQFVLDGVLAPPQVLQHLEGDVRPTKAQLLAVLQPDFAGPDRQGFLQHCLLVRPGEAGPRRWRGFAQGHAAFGLDGLHGADQRPEICGVVRSRIFSTLPRHRRSSGLSRASASLCFRILGLHRPGC